jgi:hypothetical protein
MKPYSTRRVHPTSNRYRALPYSQPMPLWSGMTYCRNTAAISNVPAQCAEKKSQPAARGPTRKAS